MKNKKFDSVKFFRQIKQKLGERMSKMTLKEQKEFLKDIKNGKIKIEIEEYGAQHAI